MPSGSLVELELQPEAGGKLNLFCLYPTGSIDNLLSSSVEESYIYRTYYRSEAEGSYKLWYTLDGYKSNFITFHVIRKQKENVKLPFGPIGSFSRTNVLRTSAISQGIGFSVGGAKDISNFRENIEKGYLPLPTDVTFEGLVYGYYFQTMQTVDCRKLFCPSYSYAISRDPFSGELQYYLMVGLNSGITDFQRSKQNLVLVLDRSGSMGTTFDKYYYDRFGNRMDAKDNISNNTKMEIASQTVVNLFNHLEADDRFGLIVFSDDAFVVEPLIHLKDKKVDELKKNIMKIKEYGGTNIEAGMRKGTELLCKLRAKVPVVNKLIESEDYTDRIIFLTDAMPNTGETNEEVMLKIFRENAIQGIYTTFIGIGVDFNTELVEGITKIQGANYYSIHSAEEFRKRLDEDFEYMLTPLVFDLQLNIYTPGYKIEKVYGSPEANEATGEIMKVNTLFPSKVEEEEVKGGVILIKLNRISKEGRIKLKVTYRNQQGEWDGDDVDVEIKNIESEFYQGSGIRKAILLSRYSDLLRDWLIYERKEGSMVQPSVTLESDTGVPVKPGKWERQSMFLQVSKQYKNIFKSFSTYFTKEVMAIEDENLKKEIAVLMKLSKLE